MKWESTVELRKGNLHLMPPRLVKVKLLGIVRLYGLLVTGGHHVQILVCRVSREKKQIVENPKGRSTVYWDIIDRQEVYAFEVNSGALTQISDESINRLAVVDREPHVLVATMLELLLAPDTKPSIILTLFREMSWFFKKCGVDPQKITVSRSFAGGWYGNSLFSTALLIYLTSHFDSSSVGGVGQNVDQ